MLRHILTVLCMLLSLFLASCNDLLTTPATQEQDSAREISDFFFLKANNPAAGLQGMVRGIVSSNEILVTLPANVGDTARESLVPTFVVPPTATVTVDGRIQENGVSAQNFTEPAIYVVQAQNGARREYTVTVEIEDSARIREFSFLTSNNPDLEANVFGRIIGTNITLTIPFTLNVSSTKSLKPSIKHSSGATIFVGEREHKNGQTSQSFNTPVTYTVKAKDETNRRDYSVTVDFKKNSEAKLNRIQAKLNHIQIEGDSVLITAVGEHEFMGTWPPGHAEENNTLIVTLDCSTNATARWNDEEYTGAAQSVSYLAPVIITVISEDETTTNTYILTISNAYTVGDTGPGGGLIFYAEGETVLEAAPKDWHENPYFRLDDARSEVGKYGSEVGNWDSHLPTIDELRKLHTVRAVLNVKHTNFLPDETYWSMDTAVTQTGESFKAFNFASGAEEKKVDTEELYVRPVWTVQEDPPSEAREFISFSFLAEDNHKESNLGIDVFGRIDYSKKTISAELPMDVDRTQLIPRFTVSAGATAMYKGFPISAGQAIDFSYSVEIAAKSERGTEEIYTVTVTAKTGYEIGETGPGGGTIFYKNSDQNAGWTYLEAAPSDWSVNGDRPLVWGTSGNIAELTRITNIDDPLQELGKGKENTSAIINQYPNQNYAANFCDAYSGTLKTEEWFLPSIHELELMYKANKEKEIGGLLNSFYWSSSQRDDDKAWRVSFNTGTSSYANKISSHLVRPIRRF